MNASVNASAEGRAEGKGNAARLPNAAYKAVKTIREILTAEPCQITVKVFGPHKGPYWRVVEIEVDGYESFLYRRYTSDRYMALEEFLEVLQKKIRPDSKSLVMKTIAEVDEENHYARVIELLLDDKPFVPTEEFIRR